MIADDIGRKVSVVFIGGNPFTPPIDEEWIFDADSIPGDGGYKDIYSIIRKKGDVVVGMWNVQQITGWKYEDTETA